MTYHQNVPCPCKPQIGLVALHAAAHELRMLHLKWISIRHNSCVQVNQVISIDHFLFVTMCTYRELLWSIHYRHSLGVAVSSAQSVGFYGLLESDRIVSYCRPVLSISQALKSPARPQPIFWPHELSRLSRTPVLQQDHSRKVYAKSITRDIPSHSQGHKQVTLYSV